jgi:hypothetical protein
MIQVKNNKVDVDTWCGMMIEPGAYYEIQSIELSRWQNNSQVLTDIASGDLIVNNGTADITDMATAINFLKNIAAIDPDGLPLVTLSAFSNANNFRFRGASFAGVGTAETVTDIDFLLAECRWINGGCLILKNHVFGDSITFQIVDKDNIFGYGANTVLDEFIKDFYLDDEKHAQAPIMLDYPARLPVGVYMRLKYTSIGATNVDVKCNLFLHKKII